MDYSLDDFYTYNGGYKVRMTGGSRTTRKGDGTESTPYEETSMDRAKDIMSLLESDDALMSDFNFLLRQKKLKQLKLK